MTRNAYLLAGLIWLKFATLAVGTAIYFAYLNGMEVWGFPIGVMLLVAGAGLFLAADQVGQKLGPDAADQLVRTNRRAAVIGALVGALPAAALLFVLTGDAATQTPAERLTAVFLSGLVVVCCAGAGMLYRDGRLTETDMQSSVRSSAYTASVKWSALPAAQKRAGWSLLLLTAISWGIALATIGVVRRSWVEVPPQVVLAGAVALAFVLTGAFVVALKQRTSFEPQIALIFLGSRWRAFGTGLFVLALPIDTAMQLSGTAEGAQEILYYFWVSWGAAMMGHALWSLSRQRKRNSRPVESS